MYVIMGATGHIGKPLTLQLLKRGFNVRAISRHQEKLIDLGAEPWALPIEDPDKLAEAFMGATAVFTMIPPSPTAEDFSAYQEKVSKSIVAALKKANVQHVVNLSSLGAHLAERTGPIKGLYYHEQRLMEIPNVINLRPCYFMENLLDGLPKIKEAGIFLSALKGNHPLSLVAAKDIAFKAAELLPTTFQGQSVVEFLGPREMTMLEALSIFSPEACYIEQSYNVREQSLRAAGLSPDMAHQIAEMEKAFNEGLISPTQKISPEQRGLTTLEIFTREHHEIPQIKR